MRGGIKRVHAAKARLNRFPYRYEAIDNAYARFLEDGTLTEDDSIAGCVLLRVLNARKPLPPDPEAPVLYQPYGTTREMLFREACCKVAEVRTFARDLLRVLVQAGHDVTDPELIGPEMEPWEYAPVCLRLIGWPHHYVPSQYHGQLDRLLERQAAERAGRARGDATWGTNAAKAVGAFLRSGTLPSDPRFLTYVLGIGEQFALSFHAAGQAVTELLAAFDAIATGSAAERAEALRRVGPLQAQMREERRS